jgi:copper chaperone CopZ
MRSWILATAALIACVACGSETAYAGKVEIKGAHVCCPVCIKAITNVLSKVDGVSDAQAVKGGSITFTTKDDKTTTAALTALYNAGFIGPAADDGKEVKIDLPAPKKGETVDSVTVTGTHICCPQCKASLTNLFPDDKVEFPDDGTVQVNGKGLDKWAVLDVLRKAGFNGTVKK